MSVSARAELLADRGEAAITDDFFRGRDLYDAEGVTHTLLIEDGDSRVAAPLIVRPIDGTDGHDATSPYGYPGAAVSGPPIDPGAVDFSATGLVSVFLRERVGGEPCLLGATQRSTLQVSDPGLPRKSRMSDRQQIRRNEAAGYRIRRLGGREAGEGELEGLVAVYEQTMRRTEASGRYLFGRDHFAHLLGSPLAWVLVAEGPDGDVAAAALAVLSDGVVHYYLSGTADRHVKASPSKNLIVATTELAEELGAPMNLGGGVHPGDGLEAFKRGFANRELPFRTHEIVCDPDSYDALSAGRTETGFFPLYRAPPE